MFVRVVLCCVVLYGWKNRKTNRKSGKKGKKERKWKVDNLKKCRKKWLALLLRIRQVLGSIIGPETGYFPLFFVVSLSPSRKIAG
jgi:hypothetical protein